jgi:hypothetical protein
VDDVDMLEDDLQLLKGLFFADGEGLPRLHIDELCGPLTGILVTMQLDTGILVSNYKQVEISFTHSHLDPVWTAFPEKVSLQLDLFCPEIQHC